MITREANNSDGPELARLRWAFSSEQVATSGQSHAAFTAEFSSFIAKTLNEKRWKIWVAETDFRLTGNLYVEIIPKLPRPREFDKHYAYMTNVYVIEEARNAGVGGKLVEAAIAWVASADMEFIIVWPSAESVPFYERHGFQNSNSMERIP